MLTVACVLWAGQFHGRDYRVEHVQRLRDQVAEHLAQPYKFVCFTNAVRDFQDTGIETIRLLSGLEGWWAKLEIFGCERLRDRILYLDLDVTVVGGLDDLADFDASFVAIDDWALDGINSSVMAWDAEEYRALCGRFEYGVEQRRFNGDQQWIGHMLGRPTTFPRAWCRSYKKHIAPRLDDTLPTDCRVIVYHGFPKPWDIE